MSCYRLMINQLANKCPVFENVTTAGQSGPPRDTDKFTLDLPAKSFESL
jgi:hypothetical protein